MKKEATVVILPTDKMSDIIVPSKGIGKGVPHYREFYGSAMLNMGDEYHHLYITTDDEIKEGDWYYNERLNKVFQAIAKSDYNTVDRETKIIATTDPELKALNKYSSKEGIMELLPQIPQSFIEEYCRAGGIDEVDVEYQLNPTLSEGDDYHIGGEVRKVISVWKSTNDSWYVTTPKNHSWSCPVQEYPKLTSNNEIIIHPIEEKMYSRDEVYKIAKVAYRMGAQNHNDATVERFDEWIKENIK